MTTTIQKIKSKALSRAVGEDEQPDPDAYKPSDDFSKTVKVKTQHRWGMLAAGLALVVVFVIGMVTLVNGMRDTTTVLVLSRDVAQGEAIDSDDLTTAEVNTDSGLAVVSAGNKHTVVGQLAAKPLRAGDLLNANMVVNAVIPAKNQTLVGITVTYSKLPAEALVAGDLVRLVDTPRDQDNSPVQGPVTTNAQVVSTHDHPESGTVTVDVLVPHDEANWVAARAATGRVAIVLDSRER